MPASGLVAVPSKGLARAGESPCSLRPVLGSGRRVLPWGHLTLTVGVGSRSGRRSAMGLLWGQMGRCLQQWGRDGAASHVGTPPPHMCVGTTPRRKSKILLLSVAKKTKQNFLFFKLFSHIF